MRGSSESRKDVNKKPWRKNAKKRKKTRRRNQLNKERLLARLSINLTKSLQLPYRPQRDGSLRRRNSREPLGVEGLRALLGHHSRVENQRPSLVLRLSLGRQEHRIVKEVVSEGPVGAKVVQDSLHLGQQMTKKHLHLAVQEAQMTQQHAKKYYKARFLSAKTPKT